MSTTVVGAPASEPGGVDIDTIDTNAANYTINGGFDVLFSVPSVVHTFVVPKAAFLMVIPAGSGAPVKPPGVFQVTPENFFTLDDPSRGVLDGGNVLA